MNKFVFYCVPRRQICLLNSRLACEAAKSKARLNLRANFIPNLKFTVSNSTPFKSDFISRHEVEFARQICVVKAEIKAQI
jgi:hypothetical protein